MRIAVHDPTNLVQPDDESSAECCCITGGGAWRTYFFIGMMRAIQERTTEDERKKWCFTGCSSGGLIALALAMEFPYDRLLAEYNMMAAEARELCCGIAGRGPRGPAGQIVRRVLKSMPEAELLEKIRGRFAVTFNSRPCWLRPLVAYQASDFDSVDEIFSAIAGSGNIPGFTDWRTAFRSYKVDMLPALDGGYTWASRRPLLPCRLALYGICCGAVPGGDAMLPEGISTDIAPTEFVPVRKCFFTPSDEYIQEMVTDGYKQAAAFLDSETWSARRRRTREQGAAPVRPACASCEDETSRAPKLVAPQMVHVKVTAM